MHADPTDRAQEYDLLETEYRIREAGRPQPKRLPEDPGFCDECGNSTPTASHLFCSVACRDADASRERLRRIQGRST